MTNETVVLAFFATVQAISTAWLHWQINRNACGGAKCVETMTRALNINSGRHAAESATRDVFEARSYLDRADDSFGGKNG